MDAILISYDAYQASPSPLDKTVVTFNGAKPVPSKASLGLDNLDVDTVPILRLYLTVEGCERAIVHVHNVFPYFYVPFPNVDSLPETEINDTLFKWLGEINSKMAASYRNGRKRRHGRNHRNTKARNSKRRQGNEGDRPFDPREQENSRNGDADGNSYPSDSDQDEDEDFFTARSFVTDLSIVSGTPFYGFHLGRNTFLKISMASPKYVSRLCRLCSESQLFGKFIQPYESHVPYILQFLTDYNIYTLKTIHFTEFLWRTPIIQTEDFIGKDSDNDILQPFFKTKFLYYNSLKVNHTVIDFVNMHIHQIPGTQSLNVLDADVLPRIGRSLFELDVCSSWIQNRSDLKEREADQLISTKINGDVTYITSTKSLLDDVDNLRRSRGLHCEKSQLGLYDQIERNESPIQWAEHEELKKYLSNAIRSSENSFKKKYGSQNITDDMKKTIRFPKFITAFASVENLQYVPKLSSYFLIPLGLLNPTDYFYSAMKIKPKKTNSASLQSHIPIPAEIFEPELLSSDGNETPVHEKTDEENKKDIQNNYDPVLSNDAASLNLNDSHDLTDRLQASIIEDEIDSITSSRAKRLESMKMIDASAMKSISFSKRTDFSIPTLTQQNAFVSYFDDVDTDEGILMGFNIQQPVASSKHEFLKTFETDFSLPQVEYEDPFFSKLSNYDAKPFIFAGDKFQLKCLETDKLLYPHSKQIPLLQKDDDDHYIWQYVPSAPSYQDVSSWITKEELQKTSSLNQDRPLSGFFKTQIKGPTQKFTEYKYPSLQTPTERISDTANILSTLLVEVHVDTREEYLPDPQQDAIRAIFWTFNKADNTIPNTGVFVNTSAVSADEKKLNNISGEGEHFVTLYDSEEDLFIALVSLVEYLDPDILSGWELHSSSWGYILERALVKYQIDLTVRFSRVVEKHNNKVGDRWGFTHASGIRLTGRQMLNLWRRFRSELNLSHYSLENIVFHIFHDRLPQFSHEKLSNLWKQSQRGISYVLNYYLKRVSYELELILKLEVIEKINEQSRLLGIDFYSIIYRGSQFKVECLLVRLAKAENFMLISPSKKQVFKQDSLECIPLVMEPNSAFYKCPLVVLDFQSLYPSLIIAYNICYSTQLGRLNNFDPTKYTKMGVTRYKSPEGILKYLEQDINVTPNGMMFAKPSVRKSLLARMLLEILNARIYTKTTMSEFKDDQELKKLYNNRQLALKLIANVTYGYTSATYSGRMPNSDIADAIVSCARETLLKAVKMIEANKEWGANVVYGDTDSLFVYLPGKTKENAFKVGKEMADYVTQCNPAPVKLKFEKVYLPSILVSKKRYVGWSYEYETQLSPKFDAKGIETVRRDGIPAQQKIIEKALTTLFDSKDISILKDYLVGEFAKVVNQTVNIKDFMFAKEVRLGTYKNEKYIPAGARMAMKRTLEDHRLEPQYKERVLYVVRRGHSKELLRDRCVSPSEFINNNMELDSEYYINKVLIPPLERLFNLLGVDVKAWVKSIPQSISYKGIDTRLTNVKINTCVVCGKTGVEGQVCPECQKNQLQTHISLKKRIRNLEEKSANFFRFCRSCESGTVGEDPDPSLVEACCNEDCTVYYRRSKSYKETAEVQEQLRGLSQW